MTDENTKTTEATTAAESTPEATSAASDKTPEQIQTEKEAKELKKKRFLRIFFC